MAPLKKKRKLSVFPREGLVDFDQLTNDKGICNHPDCKGKQFSHLQYHCKVRHSPDSKPMPHKMKNEIPADLNVDLDEICSGAGICHHAECKGKAFKQLKEHLRRHLKRKNPKKTSRKLTEIPRDLNVRPNDVTSRQGRCHHPDCKGKSIKQLKQHLLEYHLRQKRVIRTTKLTEIPADLNCKASDIFTREGVCNHPDCQGRTYVQLRSHFIAKHGSNQRIQLTEIPANLKVDPYDLCLKKGICHYFQCIGKKFMKLRNHFLHYHLKQTRKKRIRRQKLKEIPADLNCNVEDLVSGEGVCHHASCNGLKCSTLKTHFLVWHNLDSKPIPKMLTEIPADLEIDPTDVSSMEGICHHSDCGGAKFLQLRMHLLGYHLKKRKLIKITEIPADLDCKTYDVSSEEGVCHHADCQGRKFANLKNHFKVWHGPKATKRDDPYLEEIPADWEGNAFDLSPTHGTCNKKGCNKMFTYLRDHYIFSHVHNPTAEEYGPRYAPAKCGHCGTTGSNLQAIRNHMIIYHFGIKNLDPISLSPEETEDYYAKKDKLKEEFSGRNEKKRHIPDLTVHLRQHLQALDDPSNPLSIRAACVKAEFDSLFETPAGTGKCSYSSFISFFEFSWMIPKISFEIVESSNGETSWKSSTFVRDPGIADIHQPTVSDYYKSGYHRGHLVPAGNYSDVSQVAPTYYYSNIVPTTPKTNWSTRKVLETYIRDMANQYGTVRVAHFPIMGKNPNTLKRGVKIPKAIGTVMFVDQPSGTYVKAWELPNDDTLHLIEDCVRNPLALLQEAKIDVKFSRSSFRYWSRDAKKIQTKLSLT